MKRFPYDGLILSALLLGSCNDQMGDAAYASDLADAAQANARTALAQIEEQASEIDELEEKILNLERADSAMADDLRRIEDQVSANADTFNRHTHF